MTSRADVQTLFGDCQPIDFRDALEKAYGPITRVLKALPRFTIEDARKRLRKLRRKVRCVYLIWRPDGQLLYVGKSDKLLQRISGHLAPSSPLMRILASEQGLKVEPSTAHKCACGRMIECPRGDSSVAAPDDVAQLKKDVLSTYSLSFLEIKGRDSEGWLGDFERYVQWVLRPEYGMSDLDVDVEVARRRRRIRVEA